MAFLTPFNYEKKRFVNGEIFEGETLTASADYVDIQSLLKKLFPGYRPAAAALLDDIPESILDKDSELFDRVDIADLSESDFSDISFFISDKKEKLLEEASVEDTNQRDAGASVAADAQPKDAPDQGAPAGD